jgi:hypothetical protein
MNRKKDLAIYVEGGSLINPERDGIKKGVTKDTKHTQHDG